MLFNRKTDIGFYQFPFWDGERSRHDAENGIGNFHFIFSIFFFSEFVELNIAV
jgi:hypothetical protein